MVVAMIASAVIQCAVHLTYFGYENKSYDGNPLTSSQEKARNCTYMKCSRNNLIHDSRTYDVRPEKYAQDSRLQDNQSYTYMVQNA
eukprot:6184972-Pleurochrysis_carterae.AAC.1